MGTVDVSRGIKQGCTGSPQLFLMVVGIIIEQILNSRMGYRKGGIYIPTLFYADDGIILAENVAEAEAMLDLMKSVSGKYGLQINEKKSICMIFNGRDIHQEQVGR